MTSLLSKSKKLPNSQLLLAKASFFAIASLLVGCSTLSLTYNYADWILLWRIDQYFDVSPEQQTFLKGRLNHLHAWHRKQELPRYVAFLRDIQDHWRDGLTQRELDQILQNYQTLRDSLWQRIASDGAVFLATVNNHQVEHLEYIIQVENRKLLDRVGKGPEERLEKRVESVLDWLDDWLGELTPDQERRIVSLITKFPDTTHAWLQYRTHRQEEFLTFLKSKPHLTVIEYKVHEWLAIPEKGAPSSYISANQQRKIYFKATVLAIDQMVMPQQRQHASHRLESLIQELEEMATG